MSDDEWPVKLELQFKTEADRANFTADLIDGWGENVFYTEWGTWEPPSARCSYVEGTPLRITPIEPNDDE